eukprot:GHUV01034075.1.p1 GENE.GHUV01034075.1~~GHUV01034075.1.p1  ORF type:complete len:134 (+),score=26.98 GHUV01034075.1:319-720(+)
MAGAQRQPRLPRSRSRRYHSGFYAIRGLVYQQLTRWVCCADSSTGKLVGTASLIVEKKFIHSCGKVGHIEDVVVDEAARGQKLGQRLIEELISIAKQQGCYKVILDCGEHNVPFYEKCGLTKKEVQMVKYLDR